MKRIGKPVFFIVALLILAFTYMSIFGISSYYGDVEKIYIKGADDIRFGIDIRGGVEATFSPPSDVENVTEAQMSAAESIIKERLVQENITDSEVYTDYNKHRIVVRFPWKSDETEFNAEAAIQELGETAELSFREGKETDSSGKWTGTTESNVILSGDNIVSATAVVTQNETTGASEYAVSLELNEEGATKFSEATETLASSKGTISIWMDETMISAPTVNSHITDGSAMISGSFTAEEAQDLANKINAGALPFKLETSNFSSISPTLGSDALEAMVLAGIIAFVLISLFMIIVYKLPGFVAFIALMGQVAGMIAAVSGFFAVFSSFTLTLPGIAGMILSVGMGVDCNIIIASRIKEELYAGKSIDGAIDSGYKNAYSSVIDGNVTVIIVAVVLMGAFGPASSIFSKILTPVFFMFGGSTEGTIYSFGFTLLVGVILNFVMGITASRLMTKSLSRFKPLRKAKLYGGEA